ncbi:hypothetical protein MPSI1_003620 [Malassezia psittaci]|uniref:pH-response regulator protein palC n=1 Tax=Malassezia psittaci TaxID=1821823 RepID=A0AAF0F814_9BASI|nr:hypothetical protein MPSI1_003620 [Malassezia psittaci]
MYIYALPTTHAVSFTEHLQTDALHKELASATQLRASLEQAVNRAQGATNEYLGVIQRATEYIPVLLGVYNSVLTDSILSQSELVFVWRSALGRHTKYAMHGVLAELCAVHILLGMALSNQAASMVHTLGLYELDSSKNTMERQQNDQQIKVATDWLCRAAGIFDYVATRLVPKYKPATPRLPEMTSDACLAMARFCMAEAHRLALRRLQSPALAFATDTVTPGPPLPPNHPSAALLAKLHLHTASLYDQGASLLQLHEPSSSKHTATPSDSVERSPSRAQMQKLKNKMHKLKTTTSNAFDSPISESLTRYAMHETTWHRALAHKWLGIDAGEHAQEIGVGIAHLALAQDQLQKIALKIPKQDDMQRDRISLRDQRRVWTNGKDVAKWWVRVELANVEHWHNVYHRLNDTVRFQRVPHFSELQGVSEGRAALVMKPYEPPTPSFGPSADTLLDATQCVGLDDPTETRRQYAGAGAYY